MLKVVSIVGGGLCSTALKVVLEMVIIVLGRLCSSKCTKKEGTAYS